jgi:hypothetical protein
VANQLQGQAKTPQSGDQYCDRIGGDVRVISSAVSQKPVCEHLWETTIGEHQKRVGLCKKTGFLVFRKGCLLYLAPPG